MHEQCRYKTMNGITIWAHMYITWLQVNQSVNICNLHIKQHEAIACKLM